MADRALHEMIGAFASGCMDKKNYEQFREYVLNGGELPPGELGEFQNIICLIPAILKLEDPDPQLKEKVARKLLSFQNEIREKIKENKAKTLTGKKPAAEKEISDIEKESISTEEPQVKETIPPPAPPSRKTDDQRRKTEEKAPPKKTETKPASEKPSILKSFTTLHWLILGFLVVLIAVLFFVFSSLNSSLESEIDSLNSEIANLKTEIYNANEFIDENRKLVEFFNNTDLIVVDLIGGEPAQEASGKLIISRAKREAIVKIAGLPQLEAGQLYRLWLISRGQSTSLIAFSPVANLKYLTIDSFPRLPLEDIDLFRLTIEDEAGSVIPSGNTVMFGTISTALLK